MSLVKAILLVCAFAYVTAAMAVFVLQRQFQYFPSHNNPDPASLGLAGVEVETLGTPDGEALVFWYAPAPPGRPTVLFFQGNGGEIGDRADRFATYQSAGLGVAFLSVRGYGGSSGTASEAGFLMDAATAYDRLIDKGVSPAMLVVVGESLGTGVAVQLSAQREVGAVVLGAPFSSAVEIAAGQFRWLPVRLLMKDQFRSIEHIASIAAPLLILHGTADRVIPYASGQKLFTAAQEPKAFITLDGAGHDALYQPATWAEEIAFIDRLFSG